MNRIILMICFLTGLLIACQDKWEDYYKEHQTGGEEIVALEANLLEYLKEQPEYSEFVKLLEETGIADELTRNQILTVWAPVNETFPSAEVTAMSMEDKISLCQNHINYIALYNTKLENDKLIKTLAGKNLLIKEVSEDLFSIDGVELEGNEQACSNGVVHKVKEWLIPRLSIYDYLLRAGDDYSVFRDSVLFYSDTVFKPSQSFVMGIDSMGNTIYDSVFVIENSFLDKGDIRDEDEDYTLFMPSNRVLETMYQEMGDYFAGQGEMFSTADSSKFMNWIMKSVIFEGRVNNYTGTLKSVYGNEWRTEYQLIDPTPQECSNGLVYRIEKIHIPKFLYLKSIQAYPYYIGSLPDDEIPLHYQNSTGTATKGNFTTMDNHNVLYSATGSNADYWVEFDTYMKDNQGNVIEAKLASGIYKVMASHRTYLGKNVQMLVNGEVVATYNAGSSTYSYKPGVVRDEFVIKEEWANKLLRIRFVNVGKSDRICIEYVKFEPSEENY